MRLSNFIVFMEALNKAIKSKSIGILQEANFPESLHFVGRNPFVTMELS